MTEEAKQAMRDYHKAWRRKNPERYRRIQERYWERRAKREEETPEQQKHSEE